MVKWVFTIVIIFTIAIICFIVLPEGQRPILFVTFIVTCLFLLLLRFLPKDTEYFKNLILASGIAATIVSWFIVGYINNENEKKRNSLEFERSTSQSKRDLKVKFLIDAYFRLENSDFRDTFQKGFEQEMYDQIYIKYAESALTSVQLLGSDSTVRLANLYILSGGKKNFRELLESLRNELRKELDLKALPNSSDYIPSVYRSYRKLGAPNKLTPDQQFQLKLKLSEFDRGLLK
jgi:hypothetical protein